jgi:hypothetical protein
MSIISDNGSQFYANKRDKNEYAEHAFELFLKDKGIKQILCGVNHPQTNGKQEKFHDFYKNHRGRFESLDKLIEWYNNRPSRCFEFKTGRNAKSRHSSGRCILRSGSVLLLRCLVSTEN